MAIGRKIAGGLVIAIAALLFFALYGAEYLGIDLLWLGTPFGMLILVGVQLVLIGLVLLMSTSPTTIVKVSMDEALVKILEGRLGAIWESLEKIPGTITGVFEGKSIQQVVEDEVKDLLQEIRNQALVEVEP